MPYQRLIIVANRLPVRLRRNREGHHEWQSSDGGLVRAIDPILSNQNGLWIGWDGISSGLAPESIPPPSGKPYQLVPLHLSYHEYQSFYLGFANKIIWPLFHNFTSRCHFNEQYWEEYLKINHLFAEKTAQYIRPDDIIWVHDYHMVHVGYYLRQYCPQAHIGFFLHIPFPPPDIFLVLPWRKQWLNALLAYDVIGFQTPNDVNHFITAAEKLFPLHLAKTNGQYKIAIRDEETHKRVSIVNSFPISIPSHDFAEKSQSQAVSQISNKIRQNLYYRKIIFSLERLDYSKGILEKLRGYQLALQQYSELCNQVTLIQCLIPSREEIPEYREHKNKIESLISEINGEFTESDSDWVPIHYLYHSLSLPELLAYYRAADIMLVTPLRDGMNLVAKEYCAANAGHGVLILSEFAGAADELGQDAILVNPYHRSALAEAIYQAYHMPITEKQTRMQKLYRFVLNHDIMHWRDQYLKVLCDAYTPSSTPSV